MRFACLGSGSEGNALLVEEGHTRVLIDCGFSLGETQRRLARLGVAAETLSAVVVTHEHSDHIGGVARLASRCGLPVWLTFGTLEAAPEALCAHGALRGFDADTCFAVGDLEFRAFAVPHDAREPVQFVVSDGAVRLGVLTDLGRSTPHVLESLSGCEALVLECNHDPELLRGGDYPYPLKQRIAGEFGHLSNADAAALLAALDRSRLRQVVAAHLSRHNNRPELAQGALAGTLGCAPEWVAVADQREGLGWRDVG